MTEPTEKRQTYTHHRMEGAIHFQAPYFQMLVRGRGENARLPHDVAAHALWHYFCVGSAAWRSVQQNLVYEDERSKSWNPRALFEGIARMHGVRPQDMGRYWDVVKQQRLALGLSSNADLPERFCFRE